MRKIALLLFLSVSVIGSYAQEIINEEIRAKEDSIFDIKVSEQAHYAEVTIDFITKDDKDVDAAEMNARRLLQTHVIEIFSKRFNMNNQDVQEIWDVIDDKCQNVEIKHGDLLSVFSYIAKDAFKGLFGSKKMKPLTPDDSLILFGPKEKVVLPKVEPVVTEKEETTEMVETKAEVKNVTETQVVEEEKTETVAAEPEVKPEVKVLEPEPKEVVVPTLCQTMIAKENYQLLMQFLDQEMTYGRLFFGGLNRMQRPEKCYVVIFEKATGKIVAVLDKGESNRMNFMTQKEDRHDNYGRGEYGKIFIQENNK